MSEHKRTSEFVEAINLAYHEEEAALYDGRHPEILEEERGRWKFVGEIVAALKRERGTLMLLDLGTGTGFVPRQLGSALEKDDAFIITDLSPTMLERAAANLHADGFRPHLRQMVGPAEKLDVPTSSVDVVTMNSVVHHFPDVDTVFRAADRALKPGGVMVVAHEPNLRHFRHPIVGRADRLFRFLNRLRNWRSRLHGGSGDPFIDRVNVRLLERGIVTKALSADEIQSVVDIHSPTAGGMVRADRGFDPAGLANRLLPGYEILRLVTYQHFGKVNLRKSRLLRPVAAFVERVWPLEGSLFTMVLKKPEHHP